MKFPKAVWLLILVTVCGCKTFSKKEDQQIFTVPENRIVVTEDFRILEEGEKFKIDEFYKIMIAPPK
jgi:hypothetical protein